MPYADKQDMIDRFGELELIQITDREGLGVISDEVLAQAQLDGDAEIDAFLRPQYVLPLEEVPTNLVRIACDIYRYYCYGNLVPDYAQKRYDGAVATLKLISQGKLDLNPDHNQQPAPETNVHVQQVSSSVFNLDQMRNF
jgi:phage gp36-like protein